VYFRRFVLGWTTLGHAHRLDAHIVNDADDFVICCRRNADEALAVMRAMMAKLKLTVNESKTRVCVLPAQTFDFLGYTIGPCYRPQSGACFLGTRPAAKKVVRVKREISALTGRRWVLLPTEDQVARLNRLLTGWSNYFSLGAVSAAYRAVDYHVRERLRRWLCHKHGVDTRGPTRFPDQHLYDVLGLVRLGAKKRGFSWAKG
jgi:hypothetical protein